VIIAGGIDLSVGSVVAIAAVVAARLMLDWLPAVAEAGLLASALLVAGSAALTLLLAALLGPLGGAVVAVLVVAVPMTFGVAKLCLRLHERSHSSFAQYVDQGLRGAETPSEGWLAWL